MDFSYGVIAAVGVLVAISLGLIAAAPGDIIEPRIMDSDDKPKPCTREYVPVCGVDGKTYGNMCTLGAADVKLDYKGECKVSEKPVACTLDWKPVCGVDGKTYGNMCMLDASDIELDYKGECVVSQPEPTTKPVEKTSTTKEHAEVTIGTVEQSGFGQDCVEAGCYTPSTATVDVGGVVTMTNTDTTGVHTFTSGTVDGFTPSPSGVFDSDILLSGDSFEWIPTTTGEVPYYCILHTWMTGTIIVQDAETEESMEEVVKTPEPVKETPKPIVKTPEPVKETPESSMALTISIPKGVGAPGCETTLECYLPYEVTVKKGTTVTWINDDTTVHTVTSGKITKGTSGLFDSSIFASGKSFEYTFSKTGTFDYFCNVHPWMAGIVHVN